MKPKIIRAAVICGLLALFPWPGTGQGAEVHDVNQVIDVEALTPQEVYRFVPDYLWIAPGDTIRFLNSVGDHTVTSIRGIWPEGAETVDIAHQAVAEVTLTEPGVYGFRCKVHGRHGMYALVVVGSPDANLDRIDLARISRRGRPVFDGLLERLREDMADRRK